MAGWAVSNGALKSPTSSAGGGALEAWRVELGAGPLEEAAEVAVLVVEKREEEKSPRSRPPKLGGPEEGLETCSGENTGGEGADGGVVCICVGGGGAGR